MMHVLHFNQAIVKKGLFIILLLFATSIINSANAQTPSIPSIPNLPNIPNVANVPSIPNIPNVSNISGGGTQIIQDLRSGATSLPQASSLLSQQGNIPLGSASNLLGSLQNNTKIDIPTSGNLLDGIIGGQSGINIGNISSVTDAIQGLTSGQATPQAIAGVVNGLASGAIPPDLSQALSSIPDLGSLTSISSISDVFENPQIASALGDIAGQLGVPAQATQAIEAISNITALVANPQAILQNPQAIAGLAQSVISALPESIQGPLTEALGGVAGLTGALSGGIGNAAASISGGGAAAAAAGQTTPEAAQQAAANNLCFAACDSCGDCAPGIHRNHQSIRAHVTSEFEQHRNWITTTYFLENILPAMMLMSEQLVVGGMQQVQAIGKFFDAKHQLETQRLFQTLTAKTHKDYHPSESLCKIGTNVKSLAASERRTNLTQMALANRMMKRQLSNNDTLSSKGEGSDRESRLNLFIEKFCNKTDHAGALEELCENSSGDVNQINMDVNYTNTLENKLTLDLDFTDDGAGDVTEDEENIFALSANLFGHNVLPTIENELLANRDGRPLNLANYYLDIRAVAAKRSVAQNSFAAITALKTEGDNESAPFLKAILAEAGINPDEIEARLGENPSYFAQMEVMTKDLYQDPNFYANLYDKPVNIERKGAALQAIELMQDRDIYRSLIRSEAVLATLLETLTRSEQSRVSNELESLNLDGEKTGGQR